jgi:hypothetical protein
MKTVQTIISIVTFITCIAADAQPINEGASPDKPYIVVDFDVDNPNVVIYAVLPGAAGANSTSAYAEFTLNGTGSAYGTFEAHALTDTEWANVDGWYVGYEGDFSSTFTAQGVRSNTGGVEGVTSTFTTSQSLDVVGVGSPTYSGQIYTGGGLLVIGQAAASSLTDTWALGTGQLFDTTGSCVTLTFDTQFEQRDTNGFVIGTPVSNTFTVSTSGVNSYSGVAETGSYDAESLGVQPNTPGFGFTMSAVELDLDCNPMQVFVQMSNGQIVGETATWYTHPTYPGITP